MKLFTLETARVLDPPTEPEFTPEGLIIPQEYFSVFENYLEAVYRELDALDYSTIVVACYNDNIGPVGGFMPWLEEAALLLWVMALKCGQTKALFFPKSVAADIYRVSKEMYAAKRLAQSEAFNNLTIN